MEPIGGTGFGNTAARPCSVTPFGNPADLSSLARSHDSDPSRSSGGVRRRTPVSRIADGFVIALILGYIAIFSTLQILKHQSFHTGYDFAIFDQVVWNSVRGRLLETSITGLGNTWLGTHFAPILLALVPVYALWDDPQALLVVQTIAIALTVLPIYWMARRRLGHLLAVVLVFAFFLFPAQQYVNLSEFHDIALAMPLLALATFFLIDRRYPPSLLCLALALMAKEEIALVVCAFGLVIFLQGQRKLGVALMLFGIAWAILLLQYVIPFFAGADKNYIIRLHYASLGNSLPEVLSTIILRPQLALAIIWTPPKADFILNLLLPLLFLPVLGWDVLLLALPTLGYLLLAGDAQSSIRFQYTAPIIPFLFFAAIIGMQRILARRLACTRVMQIVLPGLLLGATLMGYYFIAPGPLARDYDAGLFSIDTSRQATVRAMITQIPPEAAVLTTGGLTPHLTHRTTIYYFPFIDDFRRAEYLFMDTQCDWCRKELEPIMATGYFQVVADQNSYLLAARRPLEHATLVQFDHQLSLLGYTFPPDTVWQGGKTVRPILAWRANRVISGHYRIMLHLKDTRGHVWAQDDREPINGLLPTNQWSVGRIIGDQYSLNLPSTMPPGDYQLVVGLIDSASGRILATDDAGSNQEFLIAALRIEKDKSSVTATELQRRYQLENPFFVDMGEIRLLGFKSLPHEVEAGGTLPVGLYWRARAKPRGDYAVSVQLEDAAGKVVMEESGRPAAGAYPTTVWAEGEALLDWHDVAIPSDLAQGEFVVTVTLIDLAGNIILGSARIGQIHIVDR